MQESEEIRLARLVLNSVRHAHEVRVVLVADGPEDTCRRWRARAMPESEAGGDDRVLEVRDANPYDAAVALAAAIDAAIDRAARSGPPPDVDPRRFRRGRAW